MKPETSRRILKIVSVIGLLAVIGLAVWGFATGFFTNQEAIRAVLERAGIWAPAVFLLIHFMQILVPVIPGGAALTVGVIMFGPFWGFLYNMIGNCGGSLIAFLLARRLGRAFVEHFADEEQIAKYEQKLTQSEKGFTAFFAVAILLPFMPDDLLCMIAGLSKMPTRRFLLILCLLKIPTILVYSLGAAAILPH